MKLSGSDIIVECLLEQGADTIFGYPVICRSSVFSL